MNRYGEHKKAPKFQKSLYTEEVEQTEIIILAALIFGDLDFSEVQGVLVSRDFYTEDHQSIFKVLEELYRKGEPTDILTVTNGLRNARRSNGREWTQYLLSLDANALPLSTNNLDYHIRNIITFSRKRELCNDAHNLAMAVSNDNLDDVRSLVDAISNYQYDDTFNDVLILAEQAITPRTWLLEGAIPDGYPTIIYGAGGLGKSFLALQLAILACQGGQKFLHLKFPEKPKNVLLVDYELDESEQARRAKQIARGLNLPDVPINLHYISPAQGLARLLPKLKGLIQSKDIRFVIIDSIGASGTDGESVQDVVSLLTKIKELGAPTLVLDHQSKMQSGDKYGNKTPFGTVYKENLSRSVFQLSKVEAVGNRVTLKLRHRKANFSRLLDDLVFDMYFEGDRVLFTESNVKSDETKEVDLVDAAIRELEGEGRKVNQDAIKERLKGVLAKNKVVSILEERKGELWDEKPGNRKEKLYKSKNPKSGSLSNQTFGLLENERDFEIPPELMDDNEELGGW